MKTCGFRILASLFVGTIAFQAHAWNPFNINVNEDNSQFASNASGTIYVNADNLSLRSAPFVDGSSTYSQQYRRNTKLNVIRHDGNWYFVSDGNGRQGWVSARQVSRQSPQSSGNRIARTTAPTTAPAAPASAPEAAPVFSQEAVTAAQKAPVAAPASAAPAAPAPGSPSARNPFPEVPGKETPGPSVAPAPDVTTPEKKAETAKPATSTLASNRDPIADLGKAWGLKDDGKGNWVVDKDSSVWKDDKDPCIESFPAYKIKNSASDKRKKKWAHDRAIWDAIVKQIGSLRGKSYQNDQANSAIGPIGLSFAKGGQIMTNLNVMGTQVENAPTTLCIRNNVVTMSIVGTGRFNGKKGELTLERAGKGIHAVGTLAGTIPFDETFSNVRQ